LYSAIKSEDTEALERYRGACRYRVVTLAFILVSSNGSSNTS